MAVLLAEAFADERQETALAALKPVLLVGALGSKLGGARFFGPRSNWWQ